MNEDKNSKLKLEVRRFLNDQQGIRSGTYRFDVVLMRWRVWSSFWEDKVLRTFNQRGYTIVYDYDVMRREAITYACNLAELIDTINPTFHVMTPQEREPFCKSVALPLSVSGYSSPQSDTLLAKVVFPKEVKEILDSPPLSDAPDYFNEAFDKILKDPTVKTTLDLYRRLVESIQAADTELRFSKESPPVGTVSANDRHSGFSKFSEAGQAAIMRHDIAVKIRDERLNSPPGHPFDEGDKIQ